ncbi:hypothetical protein DSM25558_4837 [Agrobacterium sp. DSM 25558]|nr:hypothetical protein DSM25558_4837 [Agrobacterium sp. DSM 25558]
MELPKVTGVSSGMGVVLVAAGDGRFLRAGFKNAGLGDNHRLPIPHSPQLWPRPHNSSCSPYRYVGPAGSCEIVQIGSSKSRSVPLRGWTQEPQRLDRHLKVLLSSSMLKLPVPRVWLRSPKKQPIMASRLPND